VVVSSQTFSRIDSEIFFALKRWGLKRHARKSTKWIVHKYFTCIGNKHWQFYCTTKDKTGNKKPLYLKKAAAMPIRRRKKIIGEATPFNPKFKEYFILREKERRTREYPTAQSAERGSFSLMRA
jgi:RNA-directed DNA polymerase